MTHGHVIHGALTEIATTTETCEKNPEDKGWLPHVPVVSSPLPHVLSQITLFTARFD